MENRTLNELRQAKQELEEHIESKGRLSNEQARSYSKELRELNAAIEEQENKTPDDCFSSECCFNYNSKYCTIKCKTYAKEA